MNFPLLPILRILAFWLVLGLALYSEKVFRGKSKLIKGVLLLLALLLSLTYLA